MEILICLMLITNAKLHWLVNFYILGVYSVAAAVMAMHYEDIVLMNGACLVPLLYGESETGIQIVAIISHFHR